ESFTDCNGNDIPDECDIASGTSTDLNGNGIPDECEEDCNGNGIPDDVDIASGTSADCNSNGIPDECEPDCDGDGVPDDCEDDCNANGIPDDCEVFEDCNGNDIPDECDIASGTSMDCNTNGIPDECEPDCDSDGIPDDCEPDSDGDGIPDDCEECPPPAAPCDLGCYTLSDAGGVLSLPTYGLRLDDLFGPGSGNYTFSFDLPGTGGSLCYDDATGVLYVEAIGFGGLDIGDMWDPAFTSEIAVSFVYTGVVCDGTKLLAPDSGAAYGTLEWLATGETFDLYGKADDDGNFGVLKGSDNSWRGWISYSPTEDSPGTQDFILFLNPISECPDEPDCDIDGIPDSLEPDCDGDGIPDDCEPDCDADGLPDDCEEDCDGDGIPDDCETGPDGLGILWDANDCLAFDDSKDFDEFTGQVLGGCGNLTVDPTNLESDAHSCTFDAITGAAGDAFCISADSDDHWDYGDNDLLTWEVVATESMGEAAQLTSFRFWHKAPKIWEQSDSSGFYASGTNNYPKKYGLRILKNGSQIFFQDDIDTELDWFQTTFDFSGDTDFQVAPYSTVHFEFRLMAYDPKWVGGDMQVWDLDEFEVDFSCSGGFGGGDCDGDGIPDECEPDCDGDGIPDDCDTGGGDCQIVEPAVVPDHPKPGNFGSLVAQGCWGSHLEEGWWSDAKFEEFGDGTARLTGWLWDGTGWLWVDMDFWDRKENPPVGSPYLTGYSDLPSHYFVPSGPVDTDEWYFYKNAYGDIYGSGAYDGAWLGWEVDVDQYHYSYGDSATQLGTGASGRSINPGGSGWYYQYVYYNPYSYSTCFTEGEFNELFWDDDCGDPCGVSASSEDGGPAAPTTSTFASKSGSTGAGLESELGTLHLLSSESSTGPGGELRVTAQLASASDPEATYRLTLLLTGKTADGAYTQASGGLLGTGGAGLGVRQAIRSAAEFEVRLIDGALVISAPQSAPLVLTPAAEVPRGTKAAKKTADTSPAASAGWLFGKL
ncbi:MAG: thrombospondin type 3 repeat-containing protein, partial [Planctomycetota bacterium]